MNSSNYMEYRDLQYEQENIGYDDQYPEGGIKCKNYDLCEVILPSNWWEYKATYIWDMFIISSNYCCLLSTTSIFNYLVKYFF